MSAPGWQDQIVARPDGGSGAGNAHAAWRLAVAEQAARAYASNDKLVALTVAGSVGAGLADRFSEISVIDQWWGGRQMADKLPRLFFEHFTDTSFAAEHDGKLAGFLAGFISQSRPGEAYIHFVGVDPTQRGSGLGRLLYEAFFQVAGARGCVLVRAVTSPVNRGSVAFHQRMGFRLEPGDAQVDGIPFSPGYDGHGGDRVRFIRSLRGA
jgi:GNAT superfamily N-acetyltransferase